jgi:hypothetical protein
MSIGIDGDQMTCNATGHTAHRSDAGWQVSWLPGRMLTRDQAITAMTLGEVAARDPHSGDRIWPFAEGWAAELDLPAAEAIRLARSHQAAGRQRQVSRDAERDVGAPGREGLDSVVHTGPGTRTISGQAVGPRQPAPDLRLPAAHRAAEADTGDQGGPYIVNLGGGQINMDRSATGPNAHVTIRGGEVNFSSGTQRERELGAEPEAGS